MFADIAAVLAPLLFCAGIGFTWTRIGKPFDTKIVSALILNVAMPCMMFSTLVRLEVSPIAFATMGGAYVLALACFLGIGYAVLKLTGQDVRTYLPALTFPNSGNMGLPVVLFAFGEEGFALGICVFVMAAIGNMTVGITIVSGKSSAGEVIKNPFLYVIGLAFLCVFTETAPPDWIIETLRLIGGMAIPFMLIMLGVTLGRIQVRRLKTAIALSALRLGMGFAVAYLLADLLGMEGTARGVLILQCAMPVAVVNSLFAARYDRAPEEVASMVVISTLMSFATLPLVLAAVLPG